MMMRLADYVANRIYDECARHVFTITGRGILYLTDAVARHGGLKWISMHNEQAAAYAACAYGTYAGRPGVALLSTGCGATNAVSGVLCAWQDGVPCLFVSGQNMLNETVRRTRLPIRTFGSQEADIVAVVGSITKYAVMLDDPAQVAYEMDKALSLAQSGVKGPVWIDIPLDIQNARIDPEKLARYAPPSEAPPRASPADIANVCEALRQARRPVALIGTGVRSAGAEEQLAAFVGQTGMPLTYAHSAPDIYGLERETCIGAVGGMHGTRAGNFAVQNADLLLVLGCRMTSMTTGADKEKFARGAKTVVVDICEAEIKKDTFRVDSMIVSDLRVFLADLAAASPKPASAWWQEKCKRWKRIFPLCEDKYKRPGPVDLYHLAHALSAALPDDAVFACDAGIEEVILPTHIVFRKGMRCLRPNMQGAMGAALPSAIGAHYASGRFVCAVIGDGSFMMNMQELETIRYNKIPVKLFVVNNNAYAVIRSRQRELFRERSIGTDPTNGVSCPDFCKVADAFDLPYVRVEDNEGLESRVRQALDMPGTVLCEVMGDENQEFIRDAYARAADKRIVHRPIEDMAPFLDRSLFLREMVVEPIDQ